MADASERIIILSTVVLVIILWIPNSGLIQTIVTIDDLEIEIITSRDNYTLGENFTANVYLVNTRSRDVWMEPIQAIVLKGIWEGRPAWGEAVIDFMNDTLHIPSKSKVFLVYRRFTPIITGEFIIQCSGVRKTVLILDPDQEVPMPSYDISDLLDPELALSHGFKGYIDISYVSKIPDRVNVTSEKMINYTIQLKLIPHVPEFTEAEVLLAPENERAKFGILSSGANLNEYIRYSPNGTILLRVDEPRIVTMILNVPEGLPTISEYAGNLIGVGIFSDVPIASAYGAGLHRILRDERGDPIQAKMNKHSFKKTDEATLFITNVGLNTITLVDPYGIQKQEGDSWVEVSPSDYRDVWLDYLLELDSGGIFRQQVEIDKLEAGLYRISKEIYTEFPQEHSTLFVDFEILG